MAKSLMGAYVSYLSYRPLLHAKQLASSLPGADPLRKRKLGPAFDDLRREPSS